MVLSSCKFGQLEYNVQKEEVDEGLLELDLLGKGIVPTAHVKIH
jgi:hypothetical protein